MDETQPDLRRRRSLADTGSQDGRSPMDELVSDTENLGRVELQANESSKENPPLEVEKHLGDLKESSVERVKRRSRRRRRKHKLGKRWVFTKGTFGSGKQPENVLNDLDNGQRTELKDEEEFSESDRVRRGSIRRSEHNIIPEREAFSDRRVGSAGENRVASGPINYDLAFERGNGGKPVGRTKRSKGISRRSKKHREAPSLSLVTSDAENSDTSKDANVPNGDKEDIVKKLTENKHNIDMEGLVTVDDTNQLRPPPKAELGVSSSLSRKGQSRIDSGGVQQNQSDHKTPYGIDIVENEIEHGDIFNSQSGNFLEEAKHITDLNGRTSKRFASDTAQAVGNTEKGSLSLEPGGRDEVLSRVSRQTDGTEADGADTPVDSLVGNDDFDNAVNADVENDAVQNDDFKAGAGVGNDEGDVADIHVSANDVFPDEGDGAEGGDDGDVDGDFPYEATQLAGDEIGEELEGKADFEAVPIDERDVSITSLGPEVESYNEQGVFPTTVGEVPEMTKMAAEVKEPAIASNPPVAEKVPVGKDTPGGRAPLHRKSHNRHHKGAGRTTLQEWAQKKRKKWYKAQERKIEKEKEILQKKRAELRRELEGSTEETPHPIKLSNVLKLQSSKSPIKRLMDGGKDKNKTVVIKKVKRIPVVKKRHRGRLIKTIDRLEHKVDDIESLIEHDLRRKHTHSSGGRAKRLQRLRRSLESNLESHRNLSDTNNESTDPMGIPNLTDGSFEIRTLSPSHLQNISSLRKQKIPGNQSSELVPLIKGMENISAYDKQNFTTAATTKLNFNSSVENSNKTHNEITNNGTALNFTNEEVVVKDSFQTEIPQPQEEIFLQSVLPGLSDAPYIRNYPSKKA
ncbi:hypothetical protein EGW08_016589 [Elysia chlorotica]|uniref:Uncharacterized protein n=1 Tax=Elysia chlorotica TaxID=188477 RepID=A0A433T291_ELYCH|nr:hypothetical protein EGW08_016589 [Elysia chlorotica]